MTVPTGRGVPPGGGSPPSGSPTSRSRTARPTASSAENPISRRAPSLHPVTTRQLVHAALWLVVALGGLAVEYL
ncbi:hypothetical protein ACWDUG_33045, partial [Streptomyces cellulosae]